MGKAPIRLPKQWFYIAVLLLAACVGTGCSAQDADAPTSPLWNAQDLMQVWEYRSGSSPLLPDGSALWAKPKHNDGQWQRLMPSGAPPTRHGETELWARVRLAGPVLSDPALALRLVGYSHEVFLEGQKLPLEALPHHDWEERGHQERRFLISLPANYFGMMLTVGKIFLNAVHTLVLPPLILIG